MPQQPTPCYAVLRLEGADAAAFAQAQFGSDLRSLEPAQWQWSCWLDPKGRVRALFLLERTSEEVFRLWLRGGDAARLKQQLSLYLLRSQAVIGMEETFCAVDNDDTLPLYAAQRQNGCTVLGFGDYAVRLEAGTPPNADAPPLWPRQDIARGYPWLPEAALGHVLSPALSLRRLEATSLTKGCFPGQEIATRLHYRGGNKRHLCHIESTAPIASGMPLRLGDAEVGLTLQSVHEGASAHALAVVHASALDADPAALHCESTDSQDAPLRIVQRFED